MKIQKVVCPLCRNNDIEWTGGDTRYLDNWYCHGCGHYFRTPMLAVEYAPKVHHHGHQAAHSH